MKLKIEYDIYKHNLHAYATVRFIADGKQVLSRWSTSTTIDEVNADIAAFKSKFLKESVEIVSIAKKGEEE